MRRAFLYPTVFLLLALSLAMGAARGMPEHFPTSLSAPGEGGAAVPAPVPEPRANSWIIERADAPAWFSNMGDRSLALDAQGHPHIAYGGDFLYHAWHDGTAWQRETVDASGGVGRYTSLALDAAGFPHVIYYDSLNHHLKYAHYDGAAWRISTVDGAGPSYSSLALDHSGRPHVSYADTSGLLLKYAYHDGSTWVITTVDSDPTKKPFVSLALDRNGRPHIAYADSGVRYAWYDGSAWNIEQVDLAAGGYVSLALDSHDCAHLSYHAITVVKYAFRSSDGGWTVQVIDDGATGDRGPGPVFPTAGEESDRLAGGEDIDYHASLVVDALERPHIAYRAPRSGDDGLRYAWYDGATWRFVWVNIWGGAYCSLVLDFQGRPHVSYYAFDDPDFYRGVLEHAWYNGVTWQYELVDRLGEAGRYASLALDHSGRPRISHWDGANETLVYSWYNAAWQSEVVAYGGGWWGIMGGYTSLELDAADQPGISYLDVSRLMYAWYSGTVWMTETVDSVNMYGSTSLALDRDGRPHVGYQTVGAIRYAWYDGTAWITETVDSIGIGSWAVQGASAAGGEGETRGGGYVEAFVSLALDAAARPHLAYCDPGTGELIHAWRDGASWIFETVDSVGGIACSTALALDSFDRPRISYYDSVGGDLCYAHDDGAGWVIETVDGAGNVGLDTSLALDSAGLPHISYHDETNGSLKYAQYDGRSWRIERVDAGGDVGHHTSVALDSLDQTHIAYFDAVNRDLKYAFRPCTQVSAVEIVGPPVLLVGQMGVYVAAEQPVTASLPITFTWDNGVMGRTAGYSWTMTGTYTLTVTGTNACGQGHGSLMVRVLDEWPYHFCLPLLFRGQGSDSCQNER